MNQNKSDQKQTGYPGSVPADQTAQEADLSEDVLKPSAFSKDVQEPSALSENVQEPHAFPENDPERDSSAAQNEADQPDNSGHHHK